MAIHRWRIGIGRRGGLVAINSWRISVHYGRRIIAVRGRIVGIGCGIAMTSVLAFPITDFLNWRCARRETIEARQTN